MAMEIKVENVVASATLKTRIPLEKLVNELEGVEYEPDQFPGIVLRLEKPKTACLIFGSGKIVCTGAKSTEETQEAIKKVIDILKKAGVEIPEDYEIEIQNIVASAKLNMEIDLDEIAFKLENAEYEPEQFPGLVVRLDDPKVAFLLFSSGKIVCTGARNEEDVKRAVEILESKLKEVLKKR
jgi:transcription initiation factor TFIID TATA-box-binding protein